MCTAAKDCCVMYIYYKPRVGIGKCLSSVGHLVSSVDGGARDGPGHAQSGHSHPTDTPGQGQARHYVVWNYGQ